MTKTKIGTILLAFLACLLMLSPQPAVAKQKKGKKGKDRIGEFRNEGIDVVQGRLFRKGLRHEFTLTGGVVPNNTFLAYQMLQAQYTFHFRETIGFEGMYSYVLSQEKDIIDDLKFIECEPPVTNTTGSPICGVTLKNPPDPIQHIFFGSVVWSPIYGKFAIFSKKIIHFDIFLLAGAGLFKTERNNRFAFNIGTGFKFFLNDWAALRVEFRNFTVREGPPFNHIVNNRLFSVGLSAFFPPSRKK